MKNQRQVLSQSFIKNPQKDFIVIYPVKNINWEISQICHLINKVKVVPG